jgi:hypothetical protein
MRRAGNSVRHAIYSCGRTSRKAPPQAPHDPAATIVDKQTTVPRIALYRPTITIDGRTARMSLLSTGHLRGGWGSNPRPEIGCRPTGAGVRPRRDQRGAGRAGLAGTPADRTAAAAADPRPGWWPGWGPSERQRRNPRICPDQRQPDKALRRPVRQVHGRPAERPAYRSA